MGPWPDFTCTSAVAASTSVSKRSGSGAGRRAAVASIRSRSVAIQRVVAVDQHDLHLHDRKRGSKRRIGLLDLEPQAVALRRDR